jgi:CRISPR type I-E-associated protein CasA/Cse1
VHYNLLDEKWIPVLWKDGRSDLVGVIEALEQAGRIRQIAASNPMDRVAILRFLLALLYWCMGNPPDNKDSIPSFPSDWFKKLDEHKHNFNLLGDGERLYQDQAAKRPRPVNVLLQEVPAGNNFWHLRHSTDNRSGLCPRCCALGLLRLPLFSVSGLSGPGEPNLMAGINGVPPLYVVPWGRSLLQSLISNWTAHPNIGTPSWIYCGGRLHTDADVPLLTGLTLMPRRVHLHNPIKAGDACIGCGLTDLPIIYACEYQTAGKQESSKWIDPHTLYLDGETRKSMRAADLTASARFRMDRPWPDLIARLVESGKSGTLLVVGFATNKAKNIDVWERTIDMPKNLAPSENAPAMLKNWRLQGWAMEKKLERIRRSESEGAAVMAAIRPHIEAKVSAKAAELISGVEEAWDQASRQYAPMMSAVAKSLSPGVTTAALLRRRHIESLKPDMRPQQPATGKKQRKKGGSSDSDGAIHPSPDPIAIW